MKAGNQEQLRQPARNQAQAIKRYKGFLQKSLSCLSADVWVTAKTPGNPKEYVLTPNADPIVLKTTSGERYYFSAVQNFHVQKDSRWRGEWKVKTDRYAYTISFDQHLQQELASWHWHPGSSRIETPHVHAPLADEAGKKLKLHLPTGRVSFEEIIVFMFDDLHVVPARSDWEAILWETLERFKTYRSWH